MGFSLLVVALFGLISLTTAQSCGRPSIPNSRVIGGKDATPGSWPWQILLMQNGRASCGGSIISPYWVVTASHCVVDRLTDRTKSAYSFTVRVGEHDRNRFDKYQQTYQASQVISHPNFSFRHFENDVALIRLSSPIIFNERVQPICLPSAPVADGKECYITGWGRKYRQTRYMHNILQQARMPVVNKAVCANAMRRVTTAFPIGSTSICSGHGDTRLSGCQGDSGGPFVCHNGINWELHGAVSWGSIYCSNRRDEYSVYANIYSLKSWISRMSGVH